MTKKWVAFNINDTVRVKLTKIGHDIHRKKWDEVFAKYGDMYPHRPPKEDKNGWSEWQLWVLMEYFGEHCSIGFDPPFETTIQIPAHKSGH